MRLDSEEQRQLLINLLETIVPSGRNLQETAQACKVIQDLINTIKEAPLEEKKNGSTNS